MTELNAHTWHESGGTESGLRVYFWPNTGTNEYITQMQKAIISAGYTAYEGSLKRAIFSCDVFHFNWFEATDGGPVRSKIRCLKKYLKLLLLRICGKRTVFTFHNKMPHDEASRNPASFSLLRYMLEHSEAVVIHCMESVTHITKILPGIDKGKIVYVPHPNYIAAYPGTKRYSNEARGKSDILLTFVGAVRKYKCLEVLVRAAKELQEYSGVHFLICGKGDEAYTAELKAMAEGSSNITTDFRFIEDGEIPSLLEMSDAVMLPYDTTSELNSGASYLAFSFGRTIIGTHTGTTRDLDDQSLIYCYDYTDDEEEHVSRLKEAVMRFCADFRNDPEAVRRKGWKLQDIMIREHSLEQTARGLKQAYGLK